MVWELENIRGSQDLVSGSKIGVETDTGFLMVFDSSLKHPHFQMHPKCGLAGHLPKRDHFQTDPSGLRCAADFASASSTAIAGKGKIVSFAT